MAETWALANRAKGDVAEVKALYDLLVEAPFLIEDRDYYEDFPELALANWLYAQGVRAK